MDNEQKLRKLIRKKINEMTTTGNVAGYLTPKSFAKNDKANIAHVRKVAKSIGYSLTKKGKNDMKSDKLMENYYSYRNDRTKLPHQKIGEAISQINKQLKMMEKALHYNNRLKSEYGISNEGLWKRTQKQITKLEGKLVEMAHRLRQMRG